MSTLRAAEFATFLLLLSVGSGAPGQDASRQITCFSGEREIFRGFSDPVEEVLLSANQVYFRDRETHRRTRINAACIVTWAAPAR